jgi:hypothetical protein
MPDVYLYHDGKAMTPTGAVSSSALPVLRGDFRSFSQLPGLDGNPFGDCNTDTGRAGNPWNMTSQPFLNDSHHAWYQPLTAHSCVDMTVPMDPAHSSP